jgi:hypothetical protein
MSKLCTFAMAAVSLAAMMSISQAGSRQAAIVTADPAEQGDGRGHDHAARPRNAHALAAGKAARGAEAPAAPEAPSSKAPIISAGHNFAGIVADTPNTGSTPPDNEGAIGLTGYIQTVNTFARIYNRTTNAVIASGTLNQLAGNAASVDSFDPQIIWDPTTHRYYYAMDSIFSATDNRISFGFSKSDTPANLSTAWCHYSVKYNTPFPDYPKMGDSKDFIIVGVNVFSDNSSAGSYTGSDIVAVAKPAGTGTITTCPAAATLKQGIDSGIVDSSFSQTFTPVPSNQTDDNATGYVVATSGSTPSTRLWFYNVTKGGTGLPVFGAARGVTVPSYQFPVNVTQSNGRLIDTSDVRITQAVQAVNPSRGTVQSFWTQHTVVFAAASGVRWYEINPATAAPTLLRTGLVAQGSGVFSFNGAISPDRKNNGTTAQFGNSFVIQYNSASSTLAPRISVRSSLNGGAVSAPLLIRAGVGPYLDFSCPNVGDNCRWGDYAAATPDPAATTTTHGVVWSTNQYSGVVNPPTANANWRTQIFAVEP